MGRVSGELWDHQFEVMGWLTPPIVAFAGGKGAGKSHLAVRWMWDRSARNPPGVPCTFVEPTKPLLRDIIVPHFEHMFRELGIQYRLHKTFLDLTWTDPGGSERLIRLRSADVPEYLVGSTVGCAVIDEAALVDEEVFNNVSDRLRDPSAAIRQLLIASTHEGTNNWFYRKTQTVPTMLAPSMANLSNPADYIARLHDTYGGPSDPRFRMYVMGEAVELSGGIYTNLSEKNVARCDNPGAGQIVTGWDFNFNWQTTVLGTWAGGRLHIWGEVITKGGCDTHEQAERVKRELINRKLATFTTDGRIVDRTGQRIDAYVDATGDKSTSNSSKSDHYQVRIAGFDPTSQRANPFVRDRIATVQAALRTGTLRIDREGAPLTYRSLKEQPYDKGTQKPKKWQKGDDQLDHACDAVGYMCWGLLPQRSTASIPHAPIQQRPTLPWLEAPRFT